MTFEEIRAREDVPVVVVAADGLIASVNDAFCRVFGWTREQALGEPLTIIIPRRLHDAHNLGFSRFIATGAGTIVGRPLTLPAVARDGREFEAEHLIAAEKRPDGWYFGASIRPLT